VSSRERWGYAVWGSVALVVAVPELIAAIWEKATWPTISGTIAHLEELWPSTAVIVVAVIVVIAVQAAKATRTGGVRTVRGPAPVPTPPQSRRAEILYGVFAFLGVLAPAVVALVLSGDTSRQTKWILGYVIYGLIGVVCVGFPSAIAYWGGKDVPFPGFFETLGDLEQRWHWAAVAVLAALVVLLIHLALYPWPDVPHHNPTPTSP
jgi:hypothetical protein